jgi:hypothetical protein
MKYISHSDFVQLYNKGVLTVAINKSKAGDFVLSEHSDTRYKIAHNFWSWLGLLLVVPAAAVLLFFNWVYAVASFISGLIIVSAARKSAAQFVLEQMIDNEDFWNYVLLHKGANIRDKDNEEIYSEWLQTMANKFSSSTS